MRGLLVGEYVAQEVLLVERDPIYQEIIGSILRKGGYSYDLVPNAGEGERMAREKPYILAVVDIDELKKNLKLARLLRKDQGIPVILTTSEDVDGDLDLLMQHKLYLTLHKPFKSRELLRVMEMVLHPDEKKWFGIENYLEDIIKLSRVEIKNSFQIRATIKQIFQDASSWGYEFQMKNEMDLVWQEILTNALYHSHGYSQYKEKRLAIELPEPYKVVVRYGCNENQFAVSVRDFCGTLTPEKIFDTLKTSLEQHKLLERSLVTGEDVTHQILDRGRGIDLIRRLTGEYYFVIKPGQSTEVIIIYEKSYEKDDPFSSIKILELV
ncbi:MAG: hypothetical protein NZM25_01245 [Leptospiraceae bacterium]|nr:hypothetical protein [Leptospiraceae bacterium]MDW8306350.1 response regulator [Leptospiraceae bacterium]